MLAVVGRKEEMSWSEFRVSALGQLANASNKALEGMIALDINRVVIGFSDIWDCVDENSKGVGSGRRQ